MNLEAVIEAVRGRPEIRANAAAENGILPARSAAVLVVGAGHHGKRAAVAVQKILREGHFAENRELAIGRVELPLGQQVRPRVPRVDMLLLVRQSELHLPPIDDDVAEGLPQFGVQRAAVERIAQDQLGASRCKPISSLANASSEISGGRETWIVVANERSSSVSKTSCVIKSRSTTTVPELGPSRATKFWLPRNSERQVIVFRTDGFSASETVNETFKPSSRISRRYRVSGRGCEKPLQEMFVCSRSASYFVPASSKPSPESKSANNRQRTLRASMSCHGVPGLLCESALRVRMATEAFSAS